MNIDFSKLSDLSVVILSSPRTGSTLLANYLSEKLNYALFNEPGKNQSERHSFLQHRNKNNKFILKEHTLNIKHFYSEDLFSKPIFKIRLHRKNVYDQILSSYVASVHGRWIFFNHRRYESFDIKFDKTFLLETCERIKQFNLATRNFKTADLDLYYENLINTPSKHTVPTPRPLNYLEFKEWGYSVLREVLEYKSGL